VSSPTLDLQPFFSGIALDVTPQVDEQGNVMLHVHPSISRVAEQNKNIDLGDLGQFQLPLATSAISEIDSLVRVRDGEIVAIGGLMKQESRADRSGVQGLQDVPGVGALFRQTSDLNSKRELVILLKPTVIRDDAPWPEAAGIVPVPAPAGPPPAAPAQHSPAPTAPR
jgi:MSHA biogenesis protein MshL